MVARCNADKFVVYHSFKSFVFCFLSTSYSTCLRCIMHHKNNSVSFKQCSGRHSTSRGSHICSNVDIKADLEEIEFARLFASTIAVTVPLARSWLVSRSESHLHKRLSATTFQNISLQHNNASRPRSLENNARERDYWITRMINELKLKQNLIDLILHCEISLRGFSVSQSLEKVK